MSVRSNVHVVVECARAVLCGFCSGEIALLLGFANTEAPLNELANADVVVIVGGIVRCSADLNPLTRF